jgi:hypothetical protein
MRPLAVVEKLKAGDLVTAWQFEGNGSPVLTDGRLRRAEVLPYPFGRFLGYEAEIALPVTETPAGTPTVTAGRLVGLLLGYNPGTRSLQVMAPEVIRHFLKDFGTGRYEGFPQAGFGYMALDDPQLRNYLGLPAERQGVYVSLVRSGSPAAQAGLKPGDVLLSIDDFTIDRLGEYDDPDHGKLNMVHILSTRSFAGDARTFKVWRDRQELSLKLTLTVLRAADWPVEPFVFDRPPSYVITGGLVFMELSRQLLKEWGNEWQKTAPQRLLYYERNQWDVCPPGEKIIILTRILKTEGNGGFDNLKLRALKKVNGQPIRNLRDITVALKSPEDSKFQTFEFDSPTYKIVLDAQRLALDDAAIRTVIPQLVRVPPAP